MKQLNIYLAPVHNSNACIDIFLVQVGGVVKNISIPPSPNLKNIPYIVD